MRVVIWQAAIAADGTGGVFARSADRGRLG